MYCISFVIITNSIRDDTRVVARTNTEYIIVHVKTLHLIDLTPHNKYANLIQNKIVPNRLPRQHPGITFMPM